MDQSDNDQSVTEEPGKNDDSQNSLAESHDSVDQTDKAAASDSSNDQESATDKPKRNRQLERKIKREKRERDELRQQADLQAQEIAELKYKLSGIETKAKPEPEFDDFDTPKEYHAAMRKWEDEQPKEEEAKPKPSQGADPKVVTWVSKATDKLGEEFTEAFKVKGVAINPLMQQFIMRNASGPEIYVHLANNPELSHELASLDSAIAIDDLKELAKQAKEGKLDVGDGEYEPPKSGKKKVDPPPSSTQETSTTAPEPDQRKMSTEQFMAWRKKQATEKAAQQTARKH